MSQASDRESARLRETVRRHKLVLAAAAAASLIVGFAVFLWLFLAEKRAEKLQANLRLQAQVLKEKLKQDGPFIALGRETGMWHQISDRTVERLGKDVAGQPLLEAELRDTIGQIYWALGNYTNAESMH